MRLADRLLLFDVDGTLLASGTGYGSQALRGAVLDVCGRLPDESISLAGRTDTDIVRDMIASTGERPTPEAVQRVFDRTVKHFDECCPPDISRFVIGGVLPSLERLRAEGATMGLVTGNMQAVGWRKVARAGLRDFFFAFGAFGDESARRPDLPPLAVMRAGRPFAARDSYIIGDTPLDVDCGQACDMKTIAVATGSYSLDELRPCRPTFLCASLVEFVDALLEGRV